MLLLCKQHSVEKLFAFGSVTGPAFDSDTSDLDFLVVLKSMPPLERGQHLIELWEALETLFGKKVDLLTDQPIRNAILAESIMKSKLLVYDSLTETVEVPA